MAFALPSPNDDDVPDQDQNDPKEKTAILVAAAIIAAVRLNKVEIKNSPKVHFAISECIQLARMIWDRVRLG